MRVISLAALTGLLAACSSSPSSENAVNEFAKAACLRVEECAPTMFVDKYSDQQDCVDKTRTRSGASGKTVSPCSRSELNKCTKDVDATSCKTDGSGEVDGVIDIPASCKKC